MRIPARKLFVAGNFDAGERGQRVYDRDADAVKAAAGGVGLARELAARMQRGEDDFERGFAGVFRVLIDRNATTVIRYGQPARAPRLFFKVHFDAVGVACHGFVHRVIEHFGGEVMERAFIGAADIHAGAAANRFKAFENLDRRAIIGFASGGGGEFVEEIIGHVNGYRTRAIPCASGEVRLSGAFRDSGASANP